MKRYPPEPLTLADVEALRAACSRKAPTGIRNRALLAVLFRSGLRIAEALALYPKDLDPEHGAVRVLHGKGDRTRVAPFPPDAQDAVALWLAQRSKLGLTGRHPLFCTLQGEPLLTSYIRKLLPRLGRRAGVERRAHAHGLRHGFAMGLVEHGVSLPTVQRLLGHSSLATTATYVGHISPTGALREVAAKTAALAVVA